MIATLPETLDYLLSGGRLSKSSWMVGKLLFIIPIITFIDGKVDVLAKKRGIKQGKMLWWNYCRDIRRTRSMESLHLTHIISQILMM